MAGGQVICYGSGKSGRIHRNVQPMFEAKPRATSEATPGISAARITSGRAKAVEVMNVETGEVTIYPRAKDAAAAMGCSGATLSDMLSDRKITPFRGYRAKVAE